MTAAVDLKSGDDLTSTLASSFAYDKSVSATIKAAAIKKLKLWQDEGLLSVAPSGEVEIKEGKLERGEVAGILTVAAGESVNVTTDGRLALSNGKIAVGFGAKLHHVLENTALDKTAIDTGASWKLVEGHSEVGVDVEALVGDKCVTAKGAIRPLPNNQRALDFALGASGLGAKLDTNAALVLDQGRLRSWSLTTSLVSTSPSTQGAGLTGMFAVSDAETAGALVAQWERDGKKSQLGVGLNATTVVYVPGPEEVERRAATQRGGVWALRALKTTVSGNGGAQVQLGVLPVSVGFGVGGSKETEIRAISLHPNEADAKSLGRITRLRWPERVDDVDAMLDNEQIERRGDLTFGVSGDVNVGYAAGPVTFGLRGDVYYQVSGNASMSVRRLPGNRFALQIRRGSGSLRGASVGLKAALTGMPNIGGFGDKLKPVVGSLAQVGFTKSWDALREDDTAFEIEFDRSNPIAEQALAQALKLDFSVALAWADYLDSGVSMRSRVTSSLTGNIVDTKAQLGPISSNTVKAWVDRFEEVVTGSTIASTEVKTRYLSGDSWWRWPWEPKKQSESNLIVVSNAKSKRLATPAGLRTAAEVGLVRPPARTELTTELTNAEVYYGFRLNVEDELTSRKDKQRYPGLVLAALERWGMSQAAPSIRDLTELELAGLAPAAHKRYWLLGDDTYKASVAQF